MSALCEAAVGMWHDTSSWWEAEADRRGETVQKSEVHLCGLWLSCSLHCSMRDNMSGQPGSAAGSPQLISYWALALTFKRHIS